MAVGGHCPSGDTNILGPVLHDLPCLHPVPGADVTRWGWVEMRTGKGGTPPLGSLHVQLRGLPAKLPSCCLFIFLSLLSKSQKHPGNSCKITHSQLIRVRLLA